jgi:sirohydrochlorin ferrochelatase
MTMASTENRGFQDEAAKQVGNAREQIRDVKNQVVDQAKNTFEQARDRAKSSLGESKGQLAEQVGSVAEALRRTTEHLRAEQQTRFAGMTETLARQVDQVASYLRDKDASAMKNDLENLARRQPALVLGGALVLGLIGARFIKSSERGGERRWNGSREGRSSYGRSEFETPRAGGGYSSGGMGGGYAGA